MLDESTNHLDAASLAFDLAAWPTLPLTADTRDLP